MTDVTVRDPIADLPLPSPPAPQPPPEPEPAPDEVLGIAEVAQRVGISAHALRYYERIGLLDVPRDAAGRRCYTPNDIARVEFINCLRKTDLPINRVQQYFKLVEAGPHTEPERLALLEQHREDVVKRKTDLEAALAMVEYKITLYGGGLAPQSTAPSAP